MTKGKIFLSGGGDLKKSFELDKEFFFYLKDGSKILYIPIALKRDTVGFEACWDWFSSLISIHCEGRDIDFGMLLENDEIPDLSKYDAIYLGGGNTFKLLNFLYKNKLAKNFIDYLKNDKIIYGGSAGAVVLGKDIRTVEEENDFDYEHYEGLDLFNGKSFLCHYEENMDKHIFQVSKKIKTPIVSLKEGDGLIFVDGIIKKVGKIFVFNEDGTKILI